MNQLFFAVCPSHLYQLKSFLSIRLSYGVTRLNLTATQSEQQHGCQTALLHWIQFAPIIPLCMFLFHKLLTFYGSKFCAYDEWACASMPSDNMTHMSKLQYVRTRSQTRSANHRRYVTFLQKNVSSPHTSLVRHKSTQTYRRSSCIYPWVIVS